MGRHPVKIELMTYAESLAGRGGALSVKTAAHVNGCPRCQKEVEGMRASLQFIHSAPELEPTADFTKQLLMAAQNERRAVQARNGRRALVSVVRGLSYAAGIAVVAAACFGLALTSSASSGKTVQAAVVRPASAADGVAASAEVVRKAAAEVQTLAAALNCQPDTAQNPWEIEHRRAVQSLETDIAAARAALQRNPGCVRASKMIDTHLQRQAQTLKALYIERSL